MRVTINIDTARLQAKLGRFADQIPFATSLAMNRVIAGARTVTQRTMALSYDRGAVPFTTRAVYYRQAKKRDLHAWIAHHPDAEYIGVTARGGVRTLKPGRRAAVSPVPDGKHRSGLRLTSVGGNVPYRMASRLLGEAAPSFVGARQYGSTRKSGSGKRLKYFSGKPRGRTGENYAGVWMRVGRGGKEGLKMVLKYDGATKRPVSLPLGATLEDYVRGSWDAEFGRAIKDSIYNSWGRR